MSPPYSIRHKPEEESSEHNKVTRNYGKIMGSLYALTILRLVMMETESTTHCIIEP